MLGRLQLECGAAGVRARGHHGVHGEQELRLSDNRDEWAASDRGRRNWINFDFYTHALAVAVTNQNF